MFALAWAALLIGTICMCSPVPRSQDLREGRGGLGGTFSVWRRAASDPAARDGSAWWSQATAEGFAWSVLKGSLFLS
ncbi:hypothetical protein B0I35DRAFT_426700 [Stachybotrys elegans]|uniref:Uncharacterized protein n=1 Tax=Stachybotrys elegans TaxID=80388 RepID=A0A8K0T078_9HYPO|nr:hypothetical protein B0I35DRAFT_426700 [Stachybotrys elegans]